MKLTHGVTCLVVLATKANIRTNLSRIFTLHAIINPAESFPWLVLFVNLENVFGFLEKMFYDELN